MGSVAPASSAGRGEDGEAAAMVVSEDRRAADWTQFLGFWKGQLAQASRGHQFPARQGLLLRLDALVERQMPVVHLQSQQRQRGGQDAAAAGTGALVLRVPAAVLVLALDQDVAHALLLISPLVPGLPDIAAHVMEHLRGVELV